MSYLPWESYSCVGGGLGGTLGIFAPLGGDFGGSGNPDMGSRYGPYTQWCGIKTCIMDFLWLFWFVWKHFERFWNFSILAHPSYYRLTPCLCIDVKLMKYLWNFPKILQNSSNFSRFSKALQGSTMTQKIQNRQKCVKKHPNNHTSTYGKFLGRPWCSSIPYDFGHKYTRVKPPKLTTVGGV